ncbi:alpha/beta hydrolase-fold protein, partial [Klebsiella pneumoniae]|nr:alpha/beta hydrolase-fold protein [Klebsiella pneumoniae]
MADTDINVILPIGGGSSYYADFQYRYRHCSLIHPQLDRQQWETFITKELVAWAGSNGMDTTGWSVGGFSMGGGSALSLT